MIQIETFITMVPRFVNLDLVPSPKFKPQKLLHEFGLSTTANVVFQRSEYMYIVILFANVCILRISSSGLFFPSEKAPHRADPLHDGVVHVRVHPHPALDLRAPGLGHLLL